METEAGTKPDHVAICLEFRLKLVSQGYRGQKSYETAERTTTQEVEVEYTRARREHLASWSTALAARDVDKLWELWCRAAEKALGRCQTRPSNRIPLPISRSSSWIPGLAPSLSGRPSWESYRPRLNLS
eukprot:3496762-Amphidinium_carterae.1